MDQMKFALYFFGSSLPLLKNLLFFIPFSLIHFIFFFDKGLLYCFALTRMKSAWNLSISQFISLVCAHLLPLIIFAPIIAELCTRFRLRYILIIGLFGWFSCMIGSTVFATIFHDGYWGFWFFIVFRGMMGIGDVTILVTIPIILDYLLMTMANNIQMVLTLKHIIFSVYFIFQTVGFALGYFCSSLMDHTIAESALWWLAPFWMEALIMILFILILLLIFLIPKVKSIIEMCPSYQNLPEVEEDIKQISTGEVERSGDKVGQAMTTMITSAENGNHSITNEKNTDSEQGKAKSAEDKKRLERNHNFHSPKIDLVNLFSESELILYMMQYISNLPFMLGIVASLFYFFVYGIIMTWLPHYMRQVLNLELFHTQIIYCGSYIIFGIPSMLICGALADAIKESNGVNRYSYSALLAAIVCLVTTLIGYVGFFLAFNSIIVFYICIIGIHLTFHGAIPIIHCAMLNSDQSVVGYVQKNKYGRKIIGYYFFMWMSYGFGTFLGIVTYTVLQYFTGLDVALKICWAFLAFSAIFFLASSYFARLKSSDDQQEYTSTLSGHSAAFSIHSGFMRGTIDDDDTSHVKNILFYQGRIPSKPQGDFIDNIHKSWYGDYVLLEAHHSYIQWLFPIRESGLNHEAQPLTKHEANQFRISVDMRTRLLKSYMMMLDFYGLQLKNPRTGEVERKTSNNQLRYDHLNDSFHNYLRITRIMKCLGIVGYEKYKYHFLKFMVFEMFQHNELENARESLIRYWIPTLRKNEQQSELDQLIQKLSKGKRVVNRSEGIMNDGFGDEFKNPSWATELFELDLTKDEAIDTIVKEFSYPSNLSFEMIDEQGHVPTSCEPQNSDSGSRNLLFEGDDNTNNSRQNPKSNENGSQTTALESQSITIAPGPPINASQPEEITEVPNSIDMNAQAPNA